MVALVGRNIGSVHRDEFSRKADRTTQHFRGVCGAGQLLGSGEQRLHLRSALRGVVLGAEPGGRLIRFPEGRCPGLAERSQEAFVMDAETGGAAFIVQGNHRETFSHWSLERNRQL